VLLTSPYDVHPAVRLARVCFLGDKNSQALGLGIEITIAGSRLLPATIRHRTSYAPSSKQDCVLVPVLGRFSSSNRKAMLKSTPELLRYMSTSLNGMSLNRKRIEDLELDEQRL
jgi:hypothetical protein